MKKLGVLLVLFVSWQAIAQWHPFEIAMVRQANFKLNCTFCRKDFKGHPYFATMWDGLKVESGKHWSGHAVYPGVEKQALTLPTDDFVDPSGAKHPFMVYYWRQPIKTPAPLVVYLPGIFQDHTDADSYFAVRDIYEVNNHTLLIPNPLSPEYIKNYPRHHGTSYEDEARVVLEIVREFVRQHRDEITQVHIAGASYGAFLASIAAALDARSEHAFVDGFTFMFPPFDMNYSLLKIDTLILNQMKGRYTPADLIGHAFHEAVVNLATRFQKLFRQDLQNGFVARNYSELLQWRLNTADFSKPKDRSRVTFSSYVRDYVDVDLSFYTSPHARFDTWLEAAWENGQRNLRVLTVKDDWLNDYEVQVSRMPRWLTQDESLFLARETGGHAGIVSTKWLRRFVNSAMQLDKPVAGPLRLSQAQ